MHAVSGVLFSLLPQTFHNSLMDAHGTLCQTGFLA